MKMYAYSWLYNRRKITTLAIEVISGQHLPATCNIDPYVTVRILGHPSDQHKFTTKIISSNGSSNDN